jgi:hypothetical protein
MRYAPLTLASLVPPELGADLHIIDEEKPAARPGQ